MMETSVERMKNAERCPLLGYVPSARGCCSQMPINARVRVIASQSGYTPVGVPVVAADISYVK
jgi:hypothetical protein